MFFKFFDDVYKLGLLENGDAFQTLYTCIACQDRERHRLILIDIQSTLIHLPRA